MLCVVIKDLEALALIPPCIEAIELRVDLFPHLDLEGVARVCKTSPLPVILTLRSEAQGGKCKRNKEERHALLKRLLALRPRYLDLEFPTDVPLMGAGVPTILSYHGKGLPESLLKAMREYPSKLYKLALEMPSVLSTFSLIEWAKKEKREDTILIGTGAHGQLSRLLISNPITFTCPEGEALHGQLTTQELIRVRALYALIGDPVEGSIGDLVHNAAFRAQGKGALYVKIPLTQQDLPSFLSYAKKVPLQGLSVTMPLKKAILSHLDEIDEEAREMGAVNTLLLKEGRFVGYNTDGKGALNALEKKGLVLGKRVFIAGAGGSARAIAYEAKKRGARCTLFCRSPQREDELFLGMLPALAKGGYEVLISTLPCDLPVVEEALCPSTLVMDIRTRPLLTPLLERAQEKGCAMVHGYEMFLEQAKLQRELWGVLPTDEAYLREVALGALS